MNHWSCFTLPTHDFVLSLMTSLKTNLVLLDLCSNFYTPDNIIISIRLNEIGIYGKVHSWFMSFVSARTSSVKINSSLSPRNVNIHSVPQVSVIGPILFIIYTLPYQVGKNYLYSSY